MSRPLTQERTTLGPPPLAHPRTSTPRSRSSVRSRRQSPCRASAIGQSDCPRHGAPADPCPSKGSGRAAVLWRENVRPVRDREHGGKRREARRRWRLRAPTRSCGHEPHILPSGALTKGLGAGGLGGDRSSPARESLWAPTSSNSSMVTFRDSPRPLRAGLSSPLDKREQATPGGRGST